MIIRKLHRVFKSRAYPPCSSSKTASSSIVSSVSNRSRRLPNVSGSRQDSLRDREFRLSQLSFSLRISAALCDLCVEERHKAQRTQSAAEIRRGESYCVNAWSQPASR